MNDIRTLIGKLNVVAGQRAIGRKARQIAGQTAKLFAGPADVARRTVSGIAEVAAFVEAEAGSWLEPEELAAGQTGGFDACDLRHWLFLAEAAGVPAIPARTILSLHEDDLALIDQKIAVPEHIGAGLRRRIAKAMPEILETAAPDGPSPEELEIRRHRLGEALYDAMDEIPSGWMVRTNISGSSMLKAFAGAGVIERSEDGATFDKDLEVGAGWVRHGNRRRIDATDTRFVETFASGHKPVIHYLARPWMEAARRAEGPDPHRHGTIFAGKGSWPCEWRVFIENGRVTGVASYYGWAGTVTPESAARALEAADLGQRIADAAVARGLSARFMGLEVMRHFAARRPEAETSAKTRSALERFPRGGVNCTLDFLEVKGRGLMLLEGGPAHTPIGGGHPCAFAGHRVTKETGAACSCEGVALRLMDGIILADPETWGGGDPEGSILGWEEARALAAYHEKEKDPEREAPGL
ncbi:hypothetical protein [Defluviimonas salinarum]|uniref:Uncharacterized protein n=1 Tax=Defluviimonas salinarum TaxID=2992147 RepID=A0ABT3J4F6_9RHOB|nr:hypothetical protein [Defluviimonas salinarum]MCW3782551.1 hypothetical protein [Defluviimonas salinarum]